jgi:hypothetical protein
MNSPDRWFGSPARQLLLIGLLALIGGGVIVAQHRRRVTPPLPAAAPALPPALPKSFARDIAKFPQLTSPVEPTRPTSGRPAAPAAAAEKPRPLPLTVFTAPLPPAPPPAPLFAPYGRLIPCETVVTLESNRLDTPVIGLVTEDVWHAGRLVVPAGAEVHGHAALDRARERLAVQGAWKIVWRTPDADNGTELSVQGLALNREFDSATGRWGEHDGSAGLRGAILKTDDERELKLFAATFLAGATAALQDVRPTAGWLGNASVPAATARNAGLAGSGAVLREHARAIRESIARDGLYLRVPAGKPFYLYLTQTLDLSQARRSPSLAHRAASSRP